MFIADTRVTQENRSLGARLSKFPAQRGMKSTVERHGIWRRSVSSILWIASRISETKDDPGLRENDEKLISHGKRTPRRRTEIRRTNLIDPSDDYWGKTASDIRLRRKKSSWRRDDWLFGDGWKGESKSAAKLICKVHATGTRTIKS